MEQILFGYKGMDVLRYDQSNRFQQCMFFKNEKDDEEMLK
jgi:hypothetical protein